MIASAAPSQARRKSSRVTRVVAPHLDAEALEDLGREALEAVVAARRQRQRAALAEHGQADARPGRSCRSRRRSPRRPRARRAAPRPPPPRARGRGRRASCRRARARTSSSGRARARARATALSTSPRTSSESGSMPRSIPRAGRVSSGEPRGPGPSMPASAHHPRPTPRRATASSGIVDRHIAPHRRDVEVAAQVVGAPLDGEPLARRELGGVRDHALEIAVAPQQLGGGLLADAARARDVVGRDRRAARSGRSPARARSRSARARRRDRRARATPRGRGCSVAVTSETSW